MYILNEIADLSFLNSEYESIKCHMFRSDDHLSFISCIACMCETSEDIVKNWRAIQNIVSVNVPN